MNCPECRNNILIQAKLIVQPDDIVSGISIKTGKLPEVRGRT